MRNDAAEQNCEANQSGERNSNGITQPSGAATPRDSDTHKRIAVPQALCVLREYPRPRPKITKVRRSDTRPGDVRERVARVEGNDSAPSETPPLSTCVPLCAILLAKASVYPLSSAKANVSRLCECDLKPLRRGLSHAVWDVASADWAVIGGTYL